MIKGQEPMVVNGNALEKKGEEHYPWLDIHSKRGFMADKNLIKHLTDSSFVQEIAKGVTLVDFHADWCGPCRMLAPILEEVAKDIKGKASVGKVDIDSEQKTAAQFQITSVPTMILFKDGKEVNRLIGLRNADAIKEFILAVAS